MNLGLLTFGAVTGGNLKKQVAIVFATMVIVVALPFAAVFAMGESVVTFLSGVPSLEAAENEGFYMGGPVAGDTYEWGNCTYWAFAQRLWANDPIPTDWGNANTWDDNAKLDHYLVDHTPSVNAIYQTDSGDLGHVAYVKEVNPETGEWTITEMNVKGLNIVSTRTYKAEDAKYFNFIHDKE